MAKEARSNPLVLEELETDDQFMKKGIQLIVSTSDPDRVYELMAAEIDGLRVRHQTAAKFFGTWPVTPRRSASSGQSSA